jgi:predicted TPR repeat methyltransferase
MAQHGTFSEYDRLAITPDRQRAAPPRQFLRVLERVLLPRLSPGAHVLDLCCGAGHLTRLLADRGFQMTGFDGSAEMVRIARDRVPEAELAVADARRFTRPPVFAAVVCTFESLNHVLALEELRHVFANVAACLRPGGLFAFDLLGEEAYRGPWQKAATLVAGDCVLDVHGGYRPDERLAWTEIAVSPRGGGSGSVVRIVQRCHDLESVRAALAEAGFTLVDTQPASALGMEGDLAVGRMLFVAMRRAAVA